MKAELPLERLFLHLVHERGFALTIRDYVAALHALALGYGGLDRETLLGLIASLWARTEEESRQLGLLSQEIPLATAAEIARLSGGDPELADPSEQKAEEERRQTASGTAQGLKMEFGLPSESGFGLPPARLGTESREPFILNSALPVSLRALIVTWRRFRKAARVGPRTELDLTATLLEQCSTGFLARPVLGPARSNLARLMLLVDASPSMAPWRALFPTLAESLRESQLDAAALLFFHNIPGDRLFLGEDLSQPVCLDDLLEKHGQGPLLVISDAGAARGFRNRARIDATRWFCARSSAMWQPVAWANPMPRHRWASTSADLIAGFPGLSMVELNENGLVEAVDILRGYRSA